MTLVTLQSQFLKFNNLHISGPISKFNNILELEKNRLSSMGKDFFEFNENLSVSKHLENPSQNSSSHLSSYQVVQIEIKLISVKNMLYSHSKMVKFFKFDKEIRKIQPLKN